MQCIWVLIEPEKHCPEMLKGANMLCAKHQREAINRLVAKKPGGGTLKSIRNSVIGGLANRSGKVDSPQRTAGPVSASVPSP